ncbi:GATS-like protein 2 [Liparis tanakae]|uniref:GATS-like protein 2 n=1 Tax=Liparis tanakae TaxID=230148 RepID=A0A4Z2HNH0_9TELE|nr:GATS-like protein 2 [Liparis tanakae]
MSKSRSRSSNEKTEKMELHILEHSLKVASIEKEGIQVCTHGLIKLAFLASKTRRGEQPLL